MRCIKRAKGNSRKPDTNEKKSSSRELKRSKKWHQYIKKHWYHSMWFMIIMIIVLFGVLTVVFNLISSHLLNKFFLPPDTDTPDLFRYGEVIGALLAAILVVQQLRKEANAEMMDSMVQQAGFIKDYNQAFIENDDMVGIESQLEKYYAKFCEVVNQYSGDIPYDKIKEKMEETDNDLRKNMGKPGTKERQKFINYLAYLEGLAAVIGSETLIIDNIDSLMGYRFFIAVNNPVVQELELFPFAIYYRKIYSAYYEWVAYKKQFRADLDKLNINDDISLWMGYKLKTSEQYGEYGIPMQVAGFRFSDRVEKELKDLRLTH